MQNARFAVELTAFPRNTRARAALATLQHADGRDEEAAATVADLVRIVPTADAYDTAARLWTSLGIASRPQTHTPNQHAWPHPPRALGPWPGSPHCLVLVFCERFARRSNRSNTAPGHRQPHRPRHGYRHGPAALIELGPDDFVVGGAGVPRDVLSLDMADSPDGHPARRRRRGS